MRFQAIFLLAVTASALSELSAAAEMIEVKDRGILNAEVLSESDEDMTLRDSDGNKIKVSKKDVLFRMKEESPTAPPPKQKAAPRKGPIQVEPEEAPGDDLDQLVQDRANQIGHVEEIQRTMDKAVSEDPALRAYDSSSSNSHSSSKSHDTGKGFQSLEGGEPNFNFLD